MTQKGRPPGGPSLHFGYVLVRVEARPDVPRPSRNGRETSRR